MKERKIKIIWPNNVQTYSFNGEDWFLNAKKAGYDIPTGCLTGSCGACEIDVNGVTVRACVNNISSEKSSTLKVSLTSDPCW